MCAAKMILGVTFTFLESFADSEPCIRPLVRVVRTSMELRRLISEQHSAARKSECVQAHASFVRFQSYMPVLSSKRGLQLYALIGAPQYQRLQSGFPHSAATYRIRPQLP